ncbi:MAG TPA: roadblock/LC7 domain-containing protein [Mycobacteriales bacterium]|nr:roadblock/LC7 domain-containing protein [Mycobacteriales bacterium]
MSAQEETTTETTWSAFRRPNRPRMPPVDATAIAEEIDRLREQVPGVDGVLVATVEGLLIAQDMPDTESNTAAALAATMHGLGERATATLSRGQFRNSVTWGSHGYVAVYAAGPIAVLTVLASPASNVGRLHLEARRSADRIAELVPGPDYSSLPPVDPPY